MEVSSKKQSKIWKSLFEIIHFCQKYRKYSSHSFKFWRPVNWGGGGADQSAMLTTPFAIRWLAHKAYSVYHKPFDVDCEKKVNFRVIIGSGFSGWCTLCNKLQDKDYILKNPKSYKDVAWWHSFEMCNNQIASKYL